MTAATRTCATCHHAQHPLPVNWWTENFQNQRILSQEVVEDVVFRADCNTVPDACKPCLESTPGSVLMPLTGHQRVGLQANYQTQAMLNALMTAAQHSDLTELVFTVQAALPRLSDLNCVSMAAHDKSRGTVHDMRLALHGGYERVMAGKQGGEA